MPTPQVYSGAPVSGAHLVKRGKVRDVYAAGPGCLVIVASDRISAFDVVLEPGIPDKGVVLTQLSSFWFKALEHVAPSHVLATSLPDLPDPFRGVEELRGRACLVRAVRILPVECIVRGYIVGSGWKEYQASGTVCGLPLPTGLHQADRLSEPIFTPSTKAEQGHDENISFDRMTELVGGHVADEVRRLSLTIYTAAARLAEERGIIIADTKFEFGLDESDRVVWADEALTPDSSRFWDVTTYRPGSNPPSFDKQYLRDWLEASGWNKQPPAPLLPDDVAAHTRDLYFEAYRRITGTTLDPRSY
jgi:phosphoribosylaminoimidazole-succinocarboxamide synthase